MADSYTLRASDVTYPEAGQVDACAEELARLDGVGGELWAAMRAVADTLATSDGTVHIRCYYRDQGDGSA